MNEELELKMMESLDAMDKRMSSIRAGRANPSILNGINVDYYGTPTPLNSLANVLVPDARTLMIKPYDKSAIKDILKAINESNLGINPSDNGEAVILTIPQLTEDTRRQYVKQAKEIAEDAKVAIRKHRQEANEDVKKDESVTEDEEKRLLADIQKVVDEYTKKVDEKYKEKEQELMSF